MPISIDHLASPRGFGYAMYGAGQNLESNERLQQLLQLLMQIRAANMGASIDQERMKIDREKIAADEKIANLDANTRLAISRMNAPTVSSQFIPNANSGGYPQFTQSRFRASLRPGSLLAALNGIY